MSFKKRKMICSLFKIHGLMVLCIKGILIVPELTNWIIRNIFNSSYIIKSIIHKDAICEHHRWHMVSFPSFILQIKNDFSLYPYACKNKNKTHNEYSLFSSYMHLYKKNPDISISSSTYMNIQEHQYPLKYTCTHAGVRAAFFNGTYELS